MFRNMSATLAMLLESDALTITRRVAILSASIDTQAARHALPMRNVTEI